MNKQLTKKTIGIAASAALMASLALTGNALAAPPDKGGRNPSEKDCDFVEVLKSDCVSEFKAVWDGLEGFKSQDPPYFTSRNAIQDIGTLQCKISGAELKLYQGKDGEASYLLDKAIEKIWSLYGQGKLSYEGLDLLNSAFGAAKSCIDGY